MQMARDRELDELAATLKQKLSESQPYIERPPQLSMSDGSACWINQDRRCDTDCRAYDIGVDPPEGPSVCTLLSAAISVVENLDQLIRVGDLLKKTTQDRARVAPQQSVPDPTGRKF